MDTRAISTLKEQVTGKVILPTDPDYDGVRNAFAHAGHPAVVIQPHNNQDVAAAIQFARNQRLALGVRSGGHGINGLSTNEGGVVVDLSAMNSVEVLDDDRVRIGGGAKWGVVAKTLHAHGLGLSSGDTNSVGVGGLTLGGGVGWLVRKYGLALDSLEAADIVTADGQTLHLSNNENADLFWAIRGGGGNFGIVTSFEFHAHRLNTVVGGQAFYPASELGQIVSGWTAYMRTAPEELNSTLVLMPGFGPQMPPTVMLIVCFGGEDEAAANQAIQPLLELGTLQQKNIKKKPYFEMLEDVSPPPEMKSVANSGFVQKLDDAVIDTLAAHYGQPNAPIVQIRYLGGAVARIDPDATAFAHRDNEALLWIVSLMSRDVPADQAQQQNATATGPLAPYLKGAYVNFQSSIDEASVKAAYPAETYARLAKIKAAYDPDNIFNQNANIAPSA